VEFAPLAASLIIQTEAVLDDVDAQLAEGDVIVSSRRGKKDLGDELRIESWSRDEAVLEFYLAAGAAGLLYDVVAQLAGVSAAEARAARVARTRVVLAEADAVGD
jgi:hypothetical protein